MVKYFRKRLYRRKRRLPSGRRLPRSGTMAAFYGRGSGLRMAARSLYSYKQIVLNPTGIGPVNVPAASTFLGAYNFQLSQAGGNVGPFTQLYDQYRIKKIVWQLIPKWNSSDIDTTNNGGNLPMVATCIDYDDSNTPAAFGDIIQRQNAKLHRAGSKIITRTLVPCANFVVDATTGALNAKKSPWLDIANISVPHYGIKLGITGVAVPQDYEVVVKYYLQFRQVR